MGLKEATLSNRSFMRLFALMYAQTHQVALSSRLRLDAGIAEVLFCARINVHHAVTNRRYAE